MEDQIKSPWLQEPNILQCGILLFLGSLTLSSAYTFSIMMIGASNADILILPADEYKIIKFLNCIIDSGYTIAILILFGCFLIFS